MPKHTLINTHCVLKHQNMHPINNPRQKSPVSTWYRAVYSLQVHSVCTRGHSAGVIYFEILRLMVRIFKCFQVQLTIDSNRLNVTDRREQRYTTCDPVRFSMTPALSQHEGGKSSSSGNSDWQQDWRGTNMFPTKRTIRTRRRLRTQLGDI